MNQVFKEDLIEDKRNIRAYLAWASICIVWGTTYLAIRIGVESMPPMLFAGIRWIIAGTFFFIFLWYKKYKLPSVYELFHSALVGILLIGVANGLVVTAEQWVPSGLAALLITTMPFWMTGFESVLPSGKKFNLIIILGLLCGFSGVAIILWDDINNLFDTEYFVGILLILLSVISWSVGSLFSKYNKITIHALMSASIQMIVAGIAQTLLGIILGEHNYFELNQNGVLSILYLIIFGSFFGYAAYIYAIEHLPVSFVATYTYINPIIALFLGWLILDETLNSTIAIGALIILFGVWLVRRGNTIREVKERLQK
ncbi:MAG: EamA family transporter [Ignavibacteriae bacterium]|nr:multidrug DMT transporter permease [Ignavibacteriota bacterium]NOG97961.1 EamA family transporter [Ignavibacteriota bacterium]